MQSWIVYTMIYGICNGIFQCAKKKSLEKNSIYEVLAIFSLISFLLSVPTSENILNVEINNIIMIFFKSLVIVIAWLLGLYAISRMPISLYSVVNLSKIIFSIMMSTIILGEKLTLSIILGASIIILGLILVNKVSNTNEYKETDFKIILILLISCFFNSISAIIDKEVLKYITATQLQFWFLFFLTCNYWLIIIFKKRKINFKVVKKNYWIIITAIALILGDRFLFIANENPESKVSIMTLIKQISVIEGIILGKIFFKEKNIVKKLSCSILIIFGIMITLL